MVHHQHFEETLQAMPRFGVACYGVLKSWGYTFEEAEHEGRVQLFLALLQGEIIEYPQTFITQRLKWNALDQHRASQHFIQLDIELQGAIVALFSKLLKS